MRFATRREWLKSSVLKLSDKSRWHPWADVFGGTKGAETTLAASLWPLSGVRNEPFLELSDSFLTGLWPSVSGKGRVRSSPYSAKRGDRDAYPTDHDDTALSPVHATVLKECLAACPTACSGCDPRSGQEDCGLHPAGGGFGG